MARETGSGRTPQRVIDELNIKLTKTSLNAISKATGVGISALHRYQKGIGEPTTATLEKLAVYFGVSVLKLRGDSVFDQMTAHDYYGKFASTIDVFLELSLKSRLLEKNRSFLLAVVSMAKMITEMPPELQEVYEQKYIRKIQKTATDVIEKYSEFDLFERFMPPATKPLVRKRGAGAKAESVHSSGVVPKKSKTIT